MSSRISWLGGLIVAATFSSSGGAQDKADSAAKAKAFIATHEAKVKPLEVASGLASRAPNRPAPSSRRPHLNSPIWRSRSWCAR
jgi:hypothetical protein